MGWTDDRLTGLLPFVAMASYWTLVMGGGGEHSGLPVGLLGFLLGVLLAEDKWAENNLVEYAASEAHATTVVGLVHSHTPSLCGCLHIHNTTL